MENDIVSRFATFILNICILFSAPHELRFIETPYVWYGYYFLSLVATYKYLMNCKKYDIFNYRQLYLKEKGLNLDSKEEILDSDIMDCFEAKYTGITFSWSKIMYKPKMTSKEKGGIHKDESTVVQVMMAWIWHHDATLGWYFILLNPMFVLGAHFSGMEIFFIDFLILVVLSQLLHQITHDDNAMEGEAFLMSVLECEQDLS